MLPNEHFDVCEKGRSFDKTGDLLTSITWVNLTVRMSMAFLLEDSNDVKKIKNRILQLKTIRGRKELMDADNFFSSLQYNYKKPDIAF